MPAKWLGTRDARLSDLTRFPGNARRGNVTEIRNSIRRHGQYRAIVVRVHDGRHTILAGNHTADALAAEGHETARCELIECTDDEARRIALADNRLAELGCYDDEALADLLAGLDGDFEGTGWTEEDVGALITPPEDFASGGSGDPDNMPEPPAEPVSVLGDLYLLGESLLLCGDSTIAADVQRVTGGARVSLIHADPPYGMGKEADGVLNDNLYGEKLDAFQMQWWRAWLPALTENGSAYIWGNAPDLWRLWWAGGLRDPGLMVRNEIVWDKGSAPGMHSAEEHSFVTATERCLFMMRGQQFLGNQNKDDFWEGYEPLRAWLCAERDKLGWTSKDINGVTGTQMAGHWFTQSQFMPISVQHYRALQEAAAGRAFTRDYDELFAEMFPGVRAGGNGHRRDLAAQLRERRTFFDNTHDIMTDVWAFPRVTGDERQGHATPKPVAMVERAFKSSGAPGDLIGVPFGGSGPEYIAAYRLNRRIAGIEREPRWVDAICRRFQRFTGIKPGLVLPDGTTEPVTFA
jgi:DNA modification methylase